MPVNFIPDGYHTITPFIIVKGAVKFIEFAKQAFGATEQHCMMGDDGSVRHGEIRIGDSVVMLSDATDKWPPVSGFLHLYVKDVDGVYRKALQAGATSIMEPANQFYGDRSGGVKDAWGNTWWMATHVEDVPPAELQKRAEAAQKG